MTTYYVQANFDVCISTNKRKVRRFAKRRLRFGRQASVGVATRQMLATPAAFQEAFGPCVIYDLDQRVKFYPDFRVCPDYSNVFA